MKNPFRFLAKLFAAPKPYRRPDRQGAPEDRSDRRLSPFPKCLSL